MRIGYLCHSALFAVCGPGSRTAGLVKGLSTLGHEMHVRTQMLPPGLSAIRHSPNEQGLREMASQIDVCLVRLDGGCHAERLAEEMLETRPDLPIALEIHSPLEEQLEYRMADPRERSVREDWIRRGNAVRRRLVGRGAAAIGVSDGMVQYARQMLGATCTRVVPNAADNQHFAPYWPRLEPFMALWAGSPLYHWQAVDEVVSAARLASDIRFFLACSQPNGIPADLPDNVEVEITVPSDRMRTLYAQAHAALVLYREVPNSRWGFYGSPLKLYEALAAGTPVIGSNLGEIPGVIRQARCGFVTNNDPGDLVNALRRLQSDPAMAERLGRSARAFAERRSWHHVSAEIAALCSQVVAGRVLSSSYGAS